MEPDASNADLRLRWMPRPPDAFACARDWLREIAGGDAARALQRDARGAPRLPPGHGDIGWSHSGDALFCWRGCRPAWSASTSSRARAVPALRIARRYFADDEVAALAALPDVARDDAFLRLVREGSGAQGARARAVVRAAPAGLRCDGHHAPPAALRSRARGRVRLAPACPRWRRHVAVVGARRDGILPA